MKHHKNELRDCEREQIISIVFVYGFGCQDSSLKANKTHTHTILLSLKEKNNIKKQYEP